MTVTFPDDLRLAERAHAAGFDDVSDYVADLIAQNDEIAAVREGLRAVEEGRMRPAADVFRDLRAELGHPPRS